MQLVYVLCMVTAGAPPVNVAFATVPTIDEIVAAFKKTDPTFAVAEADIRSVLGNIDLKRASGVLKEQHLTGHWPSVASSPKPGIVFAFQLVEVR